MSGGLRNVTVRRLISALERDGFQWVRSSGSHRIFRHLDGRRAVVVYHRPSQTIPKGTLKAILRGVHWGGRDLKRLGLLR